MNVRYRALAGDSKRTCELWWPALKEAAFIFLVAASLLALLYTLFFEHIHPEFAPFTDRNADKIIVSGKDLIPVSVGAFKKTGDNLIIEGFNGDEAILVLARTFQAEDYPFIKVNLSGFTRYSKFKILWRQTDNLDQTHALELNRSSDEVTQLAMVYGGDNYRGEIADIALLFYDGPALGFEDNNDVDIVISSIELRPFSVARAAGQILDDWLNAPSWAGHSNNIVRGAHKHGMLMPNASFSMLILTGLVLAALLQLKRNGGLALQSPHRFLATVLCLCLYCWLLNDLLRWSWKIEQMVDTHGRYSGLPLEDRIRNSNMRCARFPEDCAAHLHPYF